jgi:hypothetical protein
MFWTLILVIVVFAALDAISHGLAVAVGVVLAVALIARGMARSAKRPPVRRRP